MHSDTKKYNEAQSPEDRAICQLLAEEIDESEEQEESRGGRQDASVQATDSLPEIAYRVIRAASVLSSPGRPRR